MTAPTSSPAGPPAGLAAVSARIFGDRLPAVVRYATLLATAGVERGLLGPREASRLWDRHLLNCAVVVDLVPREATVVDVGSGAGLPGVVWALARPDLRVTLLEPLARRAAFLTEVVSELNLRNVSVRRGRAEEVSGEASFSVVTARALAPLNRLAAWCLPLCAPGGQVLALKGATAAQEISEHAGAVRRAGGGTPRIVVCGSGVVDPPATVVAVALAGEPRPGARRRGGGTGRSR